MSEKPPEFMETVFARAIEARELAETLKEQLGKDEKEINEIINVLADALRDSQHARIMADRMPYSTLCVTAACMMMMYSLWHQITLDLAEADREEQFHLLRISFMALMSDMKYHQPTENVDGNEGT